MNDVDQLLDTLDVPAQAHPEAERAVAFYTVRCGVAPSPEAAAFLSRAIHGAWLEHEAFGELGLLSWDEIDECAEDQLDHPSMAHAVPFGRDGGGRLTYLDPTLGFEPDAVFVVSQGAPFAEDAQRLAVDLPSFLRALVNGSDFEEEPVVALRKAQVSQANLSPRLGNGRVLSDDALEEVTFHLGVHAVHEVFLRRELVVDGIRFGPGKGGADLAFFPDGSIERGRLAVDQRVDGRPCAAGTHVAWNRERHLIAFTPREVVVIRGVPCTPGLPVFDDPPTFFVTPAHDVVHRGWPCAAGTKIDDYGPELGMHLTTSTPHAVSGRIVPAGVRVTVMLGGGARFDLVVPLVIDGTELPQGTHVWYEADGTIREIYPRP